MNDEISWFKIYRKFLRNPMWQHDINASHLFLTLLMLADRNGAWSGGRLQLQAFSGIRGSTIYKCLKRLETAQMVTLSSNKRFSTIVICNWSKYQADGNRSGNSSVTTTEHERNTLTRIRIRKRNIKEKSELEKTIDEFKAMRKTTRKPMTDAAETRLRSKLEKLYPGNEAMQIESLGQSILNSWSDVYEVKQSDVHKRKSTVF